MGSTALAANWFRITRTEDKLQREGIDNKAAATQAHYDYDVGREVRETMQRLGGRRVTLVVTDVPMLSP